MKITFKFYFFSNNCYHSEKVIFTLMGIWAAPQSTSNKVN